MLIQLIVNIYPYCHFLLLKLSPLSGIFRIFAVVYGLSMAMYIMKIYKGFYKFPTHYNINH